jgi:putative transposase
LGVLDRLVLSDGQWSRICSLIIGRPDQRGSTGRDNRMFVEGVLWIVRTGAPWRDPPEVFGEWNSVFRRFSRAPEIAERNNELPQRLKRRRTDRGNPGTNGLLEPDGKIPSSAGLGGGHMVSPVRSARFDATAITYARKSAVVTPRRRLRSGCGGPTAASWALTMSARSSSGTSKSAPNRGMLPCSVPLECHFADQKSLL